MTEILTTEELICGYDAPMFGPLSFAIPTGSFVLIEGPNGIGKSTLLKTLVGLDAPISGDYRWHVSREERRFVPQTRTLDPILPATVADVVATGAQRGGGWGGLRLSATDAEIDRALEQVKMHDARDALFRELSEGQKQLVLLARALIGTPSVILLDEPTASMDPAREDRTIGLLERRHIEDDLTIFMIAHGSQAARDACDTRLVFDRDRSVELLSQPPSPTNDTNRCLSE